MAIVQDTGFSIMGGTHECFLLISSDIGGNEDAPILCYRHRPSPLRPLPVPLGTKFKPSCRHFISSSRIPFHSPPFKDSIGLRAVGGTKYAGGRPP